ncbi:MAG: UvrB/UvrC motif-containing protein, partial [Clostridia bacterium]|nr:UvrB/UvrC motif-containing protein [Clostridia bacterium]
VKEVRAVIDMGGDKSKDRGKRRLTREERLHEIEALKKEMRHASQLLEFEHAAYLRDRIRELEQQ